MHKPDIPEDEENRLRELYSFEVLDTGPDEELDAILDLLLATTGASMGTITLVDENRQWFKARQNVPFEQTSRDIAFCAHGILGDDLFVVEDARADIRFFDNPLVTGETGVVFYAGMPLTTSNGYRIGMICVQDRMPRRLDAVQRALFARLAASIVASLELHREQRRNLRLRQEVDHRVQNTLQFLSSLLHLHAETGYCTDDAHGEWLPRFTARLDAMSNMLRSFNALSAFDEVQSRTQICPILSSMLQSFGLQLSTYDCPFEIDEFLLDRDRAMVLTSLAYEIVTVTADPPEQWQPSVWIRRLDDTAELMVKQVMPPEVYARVSTDFRFAIVETLSRRLNANDRYAYENQMFNATYRFPITAMSA